MFRFAYYFFFIFIVYNIIYKRKVTLGYNLLIKFSVWDKIEGLIKNFTSAQLIVITTKIKEINQYIDPAILILKQYVLIMAIYTPYSYIQYF